jgi:hypothetical protein
MDDLTQTIVGVPSFPSTGIDPLPTPFRLGALLARDARALDDVARDAGAIARAVAARQVVLSAGATPRELEERERTIAEVLSGAEPLDGYDLQASYGAFLVGRVAITLARPTPATLLDVPLDRDGVLRELRDAGVTAQLATSIVGDWRGDEVAQSDPLSAAELASLAEGAATREERGRWLGRAARSPRCLMRLASAAALVADLKQLLVALPAPSPDLSPAFVVAAAALALGRPLRALELLGTRPDGALERALAELADTWTQLARGELPRLDDDPSLSMPPFADARAAPARGSTIIPPPPPAGDDDDVLEVVEERLAAVPSATNVLVPTAAGQLPRLALFGGVDGSFDDAFLADWRRARLARATSIARRRTVLGMRLATPSATAPALPLPPDPQSLARLVEHAGLAANDETRAADTTRIEVGALLPARFSVTVMASPEPVAQSLRVALRALVAAIRGRAPSEDAIELGGDLGWILARARCLSLGAAGDHDAAMAASARVSGPMPPEARWVDGERLRWSGRAAPVAQPGVVAQRGVALVEDVAEVFLSTLSGALV